MIVLHPAFQISPMKEFRRKQQDPSTDVDPFTVVFLTPDLAGLDRNDGAVGRIEHFHTVGKVLGEVPLDEETINSIAVHAGANGRHFIVMDDTYQGMQDGGSYKAGMTMLQTS